MSADSRPLAATQGDETAVPASTSVRGGSGAQNGAEGRRYTDEQLTEAIAAAIRARDFEAVVPLLTMLALQSPALAQQTYDLLTKGELTITVPKR